MRRVLFLEDNQFQDPFSEGSGVEVGSLGVETSSSRIKKRDPKIMRKES